MSGGNFMEKIIDNVLALKRRKNFYITANMEIEENKRYIEKLQDWASKKHNVNMYVAKAIQDKFDNYIYENPNDLDIDYIISLGGDGTVLQAAQNSINLNAPIVAFNTGTLGFLAEYDINKFEDVLNDVLIEDFDIDKRTMLEVYKDGELLDICLNDIVIAREGFSRVVTLIASCGEPTLCEYINKYRGDGIVISTATGSTGYNLSLGGPIIYPTSDNIIITPIACHSLLARPIILDGNQTINLSIIPSRKTQDKEAILTNDGRRSIDLQAGDSLAIKKSLFKTSFVKLHNGSTFFHICNSKLKEI